MAHCIDTYPKTHFTYFLLFDINCNILKEILAFGKKRRNINQNLLLLQMHIHEILLTFIVFTINTYKKCMCAHIFVVKYLFCYICYVSFPSEYCSYIHAVIDMVLCKINCTVCNKQAGINCKVKF